MNRSLQNNNKEDSARKRSHSEIKMMRANTMKIKKGCCDSPEGCRKAKKDCLQCEEEKAKCNSCNISAESVDF